MQKYWQLEGTAVKCIFERTWNKMKAENRRKQKKIRRKMKNTKGKNSER